MIRPDLNMIRPVGRAGVRVLGSLSRRAGPARRFPRAAGWLGALLVGLAISSAAAQSTIPSPALLSRAETAYDRALSLLNSDPAVARAAFVESAAAYAELAGPRRLANARLLANLGNAYLLAGDTGRAVLAYRRAERLDPADPSVRAGLELVRSRVAVAVEPGVRSRATAALTSWRAVIAPRAMLILAVGAWMLGWLVLAGLRLWRGHGPPAPVLGAFVPRVAFALLFISALCFAALVSDEVLRRASRQAVLVADQTVARNGPDFAAYGPSFDAPLAAGVELTILEERADWFRVRLADGRETWIPRSAVERV